jgi:uncharacterized OsmC-like protein
VLYLPLLGYYSKALHMIIVATIKNSLQQNDILVETDGNEKTIAIPARSTGHGSLVNGGELLFLSLATCFCNDIYREAGRRNIDIKSVEVTVSGEFGKEGEPIANISYTTDIQSDSPQNKITELISHVDKIAEIHDTFRKGARVILQ